MTDVLIGTPGSVQLDLATREKGASRPAAVPAAQLFDHAASTELANIAYGLWQEHGCPTGTAEADWLEAEQRIRERVNLRLI